MLMQKQDLDLWCLPGTAKMQPFSICDLLIPHEGLQENLRGLGLTSFRNLQGTQSTLARSHSAVYTYFYVWILKFFPFITSAIHIFRVSNEKLRTREVLDTSRSWKSWQPKNAYLSRCDLNECCTAIVIFI